jgi:hypothetical protein
MKKSLLILGLSTIGLSACHGGGTNSNGTKQIPKEKVDSTSTAPTKLKDDFFQMRMGSGYNSVTKKATSGQSCLAATANPQNIYIANPSALLSFEQMGNLTGLENSLGVDVSGEYGADRFSMSLAAQFANASTDDYYDSNIVYLYKYAGKASFVNGSLKQDDAALTPAAVGLVHSDQKRFQEMCGDSFVDQMDAGATLAVRLQLAFKSHSDQQKFDMEFQGKYGLASVSAAIKQAAASSNIHVGFSISALQLGGEPYKLNDLFGEKGGSGHYAFLNCGDVNGPNNDECLKMIDNIISYGQSIRDQVSNPDGSMKLNNLYYTNPVISPYTTVGVKIGAVNPSPATLASMRDLTENYDKTVKDYIFVSHYLSSLTGFLDSSVQENLRDSKERLEKQINNVYLSPTYNVVNCYKDAVSDQCVTIKSNVDSGVQKYALNDVEQRLLAYLQTSSYSADLYMYKGDGDPKEATSYDISSGCVLAPVSSPTYGQFALNCNGNWLTLTNKITIQENSLKGKLNIKGLSYNYGASNIMYPDMELNQDSFDPNAYLLDNPYIQTKFGTDPGAAFNQDIIRFQKLYDNQA